jgi:regulator of replication initiation timing
LSVQKTAQKSKQYFNFGTWVDPTETDSKGKQHYKEDGKATIDLPKLIKTRMIIEASSGGGKSWLMRMLMELFFGYVQQIIIDPEGEFSSLREKFGFVLATAERDDDGKLMGDIEADPNTADALALTALRTSASLIVDISELKVTERQVYVARFVEQLVNAPRELWHPALIWIDEAHDYAGESGHRRGSSESPEDSSLQALRDLASKGRKRGFAVVLATQRLAKLSKDVVAELKNYMIGNTNADVDQDRAADILGFGSGKEGKEQTRALREIEPGYFYASGGIFSSGLRVVKVGQVQTHHPEAEEAGQIYIPPPTPEAVKPQLEAFQEIPEVKRKKLDELRELRTRDREHLNMIQSLRMKNDNLEKRLAQQTLEAPMNPEKITAVQEEYFAKGQNAMIEKFNGGFKSVQMAFLKAKDVMKQVGSFGDNIGKQGAAIKDQADMFLATEIPEIPQVIPFASAVKAQTIPTRPTIPIQAPKPVITPRPVVQAGPVQSDELDSEESKLGKAERKILAWLALRPGKDFSREQIGAMTIYSATSGGFKNSLSKLKTAGYILQSGNRFSVYEDRLNEIIAILGDEYREPSVDALEEWLKHLGGGQPQKIYEYLLRNPDQTFSREEIAEATGYQVSGGFKNALSNLTTIGLIVKVSGNYQLNPEVRGI